MNKNFYLLIVFYLLINTSYFSYCEEVISINNETLYSDKLLKKKFIKSLNDKSIIESHFYFKKLQEKYKDYDKFNKEVFDNKGDSFKKTLDFLDIDIKLNSRSNNINIIKNKDIYYLNKDFYINIQPNINTKNYYSFDEALKSPQKVYSIMIYNTKLNSLPKNLDILNELNYLNISKTSLSNLDGISNLKKLKSLYLMEDNIKDLPIEFSQLNNLEILDLTNQSYFSKNGKSVLNNFPLAITELKNLKSLRIVGNNIKEIPQEIIKLQNLNGLYFDLYNSDKTILTKSLERVFTLNKLISLDIKMNKSIIIPNSIKKLNKLRFLRLDFTDYNPLHISDMLLKLSSLKNLEVLFINHLKSFPKEIKYLTNLSELYIVDSNLKTINDEISSLRNLKVLNLSNSNIKSISNKIKDLKNLKTIYLQENNLINLKDLFINLSNSKKLVYLNLSNNNISQLPKEIHLLKSLKELDLSDNKLTFLPIELVLLKNLRYLHIEDNLLKEVPTIFREANLNYIYLTNNNISNKDIYNFMLNNPKVFLINELYKSFHENHTKDYLIR